MTGRRKEWKKPELIVLVRSKPEEAILEICKSYTTKNSWVSEAFCWVPGWTGCSEISDS